jgi:hypothetical protein
MQPAGATHLASAATARPALTAAATAATPPPTKVSHHGIRAQSSANSQCPHAAGRSKIGNPQRLAALSLKRWRRKPRIGIVGQWLSSTVAAFLPYDNAVKFAFVKSIDQFTRKADADCKCQRRIRRVQPREKCWQFWSGRVIADTYPHPVGYGRCEGERPLVCCEEVLRMREERFGSTRTNDLAGPRVAPLKPSSSIESCACVSGIVPSVIAGQRNCPFSSRFANRQIPVPSHQRSFALLARFDRNT